MDEKVKSMPIDPRVAIQLSEAVVSNFFDAIVELVTNSDDSFRAEGIKDGEIKISIYHDHKGQIKEFFVSDNAAGMDSKRLENIMAYGSELSGATKGKEVRGFFGRGLKETIISFGAAEIYSINKGIVSGISAWFDEKKALNFKTNIEEKTENLKVADKEKLTKCFGGQLPKSGTSVKVLISRKEFTSQDNELISKEISHHYALRDIVGSSNRIVWLKLCPLKTESSKFSRLTFQNPDGKLVFNKRLPISGFNEKLDYCDLEIYESPKELPFSRYDPKSLAGIRIKTSSASLDNRLFQFESFPAGKYFWGTANCPGLFERYKTGKTNLISVDRRGLDWRNDYCRAIQKLIENQLRPLVEKKIEELQESLKQIDPKWKVGFAQLCSFLNKLFNAELKAIEQYGPAPGPGEIDTLIIKPPRGRSEPEEPRSFTIYLPSKYSKNKKTIVELLWEGPSTVQLIQNQIELKAVKDRKDLLSGSFQIVGNEKNAKGLIYANFENFYDQAEFIVDEQKEGKHKSDLVGHKGGAFRGFTFDNQEKNPTQRVAYIAGEIIIFINFEPVNQYIFEGGKGIDQPDSNLLMAELVTEAFTRAIALRKMERGDIAIAVSAQDPAATASAFLNEVNSLMKKYLKSIHDFIKATFMKKKK
jgi:hypothetical protein